MGQHITPMISTKFKDLKTETLEVSDSATVTHKLDADEIDVNNLTAGSADIGSATIDNLSLPDLTVGNSITAQTADIGSITTPDLIATDADITTLTAGTATITGNLNLNGNFIRTEDITVYGDTSAPYQTIYLTNGHDIVYYPTNTHRKLKGTLSLKPSAPSLSTMYCYVLDTSLNKFVRTPYPLSSLSNTFTLPENCYGIEFKSQNADILLELRPISP